MNTHVILVGTDLEATGDEAIRRGLVQLAAGHSRAMHVVHVIEIPEGLLPSEDPVDEPDVRTSRMLRDNLKTRIAQVALREHLPYDRDLVHVEIRKGRIADALIGAAQELDAETLIVGSHGRRGVRRLLAGSVAETLVRHAPCSVLVARRGAHDAAPQRD